MDTSDDTLRLGDCTIDLVRGEVLAGGESSRLTTIELAVLRYLAARTEPVSRETLHREVWGHGPEVLSRAADTAIRRIRKKLGEDSRAPRFLLTVHGHGYRLVRSDVQAPSAPDTAESLLGLVGPLDASTPRGVPASWVEASGSMATSAETLLASGRTEEAAILATAWLRVLRGGGPREAAVDLADRVLAEPLSVERNVLLELSAAALEDGRRAIRIARARALASAGSVELRVLALQADTRSGDLVAEAREAVALARTGVAAPVLAQTLGTLASRLVRSEPAESQRLFIEALEHAQRCGARWEEAVISGNFAGLLRRIGALDAAEARYLHTIEVLEAFGDRWSLPTGWMNLATLRHQRLDLSGAESAYRAAQSLAVGREGFVATLQVNLDALALDQGRTVDPLGMDGVLGVLRRQGLREYEVHCLANQATSWRLAGQLGLARTVVERALALGDDIGLTHHLAEMRGELATIAWSEGERDQALSGIEQVVAELASTPTRQANRARLMLRWAGWCDRLGQRFPEADTLGQLARTLPSVAGTEWEELSSWKG